MFSMAFPFFNNQLKGMENCTRANKHMLKCMKSTTFFFFLIGKDNSLRAKRLEKGYEIYNIVN